jgi:[acyl-carrier-protein] S-malonyltransferase
VRLAVVRGRLMQEAGQASPGGMVALLGDATEARAAAAAGGSVIANDNGPSQLVAAGSPEALEATIAEAKARRVRTLRLAVTAAFHSPAMEPAVEPYREQLELVEFRDPRATVVSCSTAKAFEPDAGSIRETLAAALVRPVRWRETLDELHRLGARRFAETGPGKTLAGMIKRALDGVEAGSLDWAATVNAWEPGDQPRPAPDDG